MKKISYFLRALRLPFITVSIIPFVLGSLINKSDFNFLSFWLGLGAVVLTHLGANLMNDYADSVSGADWFDKKFYGFFGGSKLIQEGIFKESFYLKSAGFCFAAAFLCILAAAFVLRNLSVIGFYLLILFLGVSYSAAPFKFSYHRLGEIIIFVLFGPVLVMGGYFIQTLIFPHLESFVLSVPLGVLTTAILFANEVPDYEFDEKSRKHTWVSFLGAEKAYKLYLVLVITSFVFIIINVVMRNLDYRAYFALFFLLPALKAAGILRSYYADRARLVVSSKLIILTHTLVGLVLIGSVLL